MQADFSQVSCQDKVCFVVRKILIFFRKPDGASSAAVCVPAFFSSDFVNASHTS